MEGAIRPPRQVDRAVVTDPDAHWPQRPGWRCGCGEDFPCTKIRQYYLDNHGRTGRAMAMGGFYFDAVHELDVLPSKLYERFFGWIGS